MHSQQIPAETPWGPVAAVLLCLLPFAFLLAVSLVHHITLPCRTSLPIAAAILAIIRLAYLSSPPLAVIGSCARGVLEASTPLSIIYGAVLLFEAMQHTKCLPWMMHHVKRLSAGHPVAEVFLIGWACAYMISGIGGFNTPIALCAPMLVTLGHDALNSLLATVILSTLASHTGSVGMAIWFGFKSLDLGHANILLVGLKSSVILAVVSFVVAPVAASFLVPWRDIMRNGLFVVLSIASAVLPTALFAIISTEFPVLLGGSCSILCTTLLIYFSIGLKPASMAHASAAPGTVDNLLKEIAAADCTAHIEEVQHDSSAASETNNQRPVTNTKSQLLPAVYNSLGKVTDTTPVSLSRLSAPMPHMKSRDALLDGSLISSWMPIRDDVGASTALDDCSELWEDVNSVGVMPVLSASAALVGATIHHAHISGISMRPRYPRPTSMLTPLPVVWRMPGMLQHHDTEACCPRHADDGPQTTPDHQPSSHQNPAGVSGNSNNGSNSSAYARYLQAGCTVVMNTLPMWLTVLLLVLTRVRQLKLQRAFQSTEPSFAIQLGSLGTFKISASLVVQLQQIFQLPGVSWKYEVLYVPCLLPFVLASLVTVWVHRKELQRQQLPWHVIFVHAWRKMRGTFPAFFGAMVLSELMSAGGSGSPAYVIGYHLSAWMGKGYLALAGFMGALGGFVTGSVMPANLTFGAIQQVAAERIGVPVTSMLAVQVAGACAGKMMCMSNILSAKVLLNLHQIREGKVVRRTAPLAVLFVVLSQALGLIFALGGIWPDSPRP